MNQEKITLEQIMSGTPRTGSGVSFDLTAKNPNNITTIQNPATPAPTAETNESYKQFKATPS